MGVYGIEAAGKVIPTLSASQRRLVSVSYTHLDVYKRQAQMSQYVGIEHMKAAEKDMTVEEMKKSHAKGFYPDLHSTELIEMTKPVSYTHLFLPFL